MLVSIDFSGIQRTITNTGSIRMPIAGKEAYVNDAYEFVKQQFPKLPLAEDMILAIVNHEVCEMNQPLQENDCVSFIPHIGGG